MRKKLLIALPLAGVVMFNGCATILSGKKQSINVASSPSGKMVEVDGRTIQTPSIVTIDRGKDDLIVKCKDGNNQKILSKKINPVFFVNILSGGAFGSTTDYTSGAMWQYDENINLECKE